MADPNRTVLTESDITDPGPLRTALNNSAGAGAVKSVNGKTGDVTLSASDIGAPDNAQVSGRTYDVAGDPLDFGPGHDMSVADVAGNGFNASSTALRVALNADATAKNHASRHAADGDDPVTPESIGAPDNAQVSGSYFDLSGTRTSFGPGEAESIGTAVNKISGSFGIINLTKADVEHGHAIADVTGLTEQISGEVDYYGEPLTFGPGGAYSTGGMVNEAFAFALSAYDITINLHGMVESKADLATTPGFVTVVTGSEDRPAHTVVFWIGGTTQPTNMEPGDVWMEEG